MSEFRAEASSLTNGASSTPQQMQQDGSTARLQSDQQPATQVCTCSLLTAPDKIPQTQLGPQRSRELFMCIALQDCLVSESLS